MMAVSGMRVAARIALPLLTLIAALLVAGRFFDRPQVATSAPGVLPVVTLAWRSVGRDVEPWSGLGLGEQVSEALRLRGVIVRPTSNSPESGRMVSLDALPDPTYALHGTVGRQGERSEIGMQLLRVRDSQPVWSGAFWRDPTDLESLAAELAEVVGEVVKEDWRGRRRP